VALGGPRGMKARGGFKEAGFPTERILCHDKSIPAVGSARERDE
jgi:hypothetical protein